MTASPKIVGFGHIVLQMKDGSAGPPYPLEERRYLIGRQSYCDIRVQAPTVSREHAQIQVDDNDHVWLVNLSQNNPVKVNGAVHLARVRLSNGDQFTIGERIFTFERQDFSAAEQAVSVAMSSKSKTPESRTPLGDTKQSDLEPLSTFKLCKSPAVLDFESCGDQQVIFSPPQSSPLVSKASPHRKLPSAIKNQMQGRIGLSCVMSPKTSKSPLKRERTPFKDLENMRNDGHLNQCRDIVNESASKTQNEDAKFIQSQGKKQKSETKTQESRVPNEKCANSTECQQSSVFDVQKLDIDTEAAVQQLFMLTPAVAANQGATPKAKSSEIGRAHV